MIQILGIAAAVCTTAAFIPQLIKTFKEGHTRGISLIMYAVFLAGVLFWTMYGIFIKDLAIILANAVTLVLGAAIFIRKIINIIKKGEKL